MILSSLFFVISFLIFFFFNDPATTEIYTLSLTTLFRSPERHYHAQRQARRFRLPANVVSRQDRKSTRLNSSHQIISYAVFCLKKKKQKNINHMSKYPEYLNTTKTLKIRVTHSHALVAKR